MRLKFNNSWMTLHASSMGKIFRIEEISSCEDEQNKLRKRKGLVAVSSLPNQLKFNLLANPYAPKFPSRYLPSMNSHELTYTNLYIKSDSVYFQVAHVCDTEEQCNAFSRDRSDVGVIATDNEGRHYLASHKPLMKLDQAI